MKNFSPNRESYINNECCFYRNICLLQVNIFNGNLTSDYCVCTNNGGYYFYKDIISIGLKKWFSPSSYKFT